MQDNQAGERTVSINSAGNTLQATLTLPTRKDESEEQQTDIPVACVLFLADNGPLDRNQNSMHAQLNIYNQLANYLAESGIASLRHDKRGCGLSEGKFDSTGHLDLVEDAQRWLDYLTGEPQLQSVPLFVMGQGEGGLIAAQLCAANSHVQGQILLTPFVENYEILIRRQAENALREIAILEGFKGKLIRFFVRLGGDQLAKQKKLIARIMKSRRPTIKVRKQIINAKWIREMIQLDASALYAKTQVPTLIIGGQKDLQCQPEDVDTIASLIKAPVDAQIVDDLTHILRADPDEPSVQHYLQLSIEDVDERVLKHASQWIHGQLAVS